MAQMEPTTTQETEFVWRRLADTLNLFGQEIDGHFWLAILIPILLIAFGYVAWMYVRDGRSVGWGWASLLGALRITVYIILALVFLLPAEQTWDRTETRSKVILLLDVSGSMASKDDLPSEAVPVEKLLSRQDKVIQFLTSDQIKFIKRLQEKNPVTLYRFGPQIDEKFHVLGPEQPWTAQNWNAWLKLNPKQEIPEDLDEEAKAKLQQKIELEAFLVSRTNLADSLLTVINRESNNLLQGIVVVSDGRSTEFSEETYREVQARANRERAKIPIFTVVVGEHREPVEIQITDLQAPAQARPEDTFPVRVEVDGKGLADQNVEVFLDVTKPNGEKMTLTPTVRPGESIRFRPGEPPHAQAEFEIQKPELEGEWKIVARVPKDKHEAFVPKEHFSEPAVVNVVKKPLRVLLFASGTSREYRFLRTLLVREVDRGQAQLSIYLQLPPEEIVKIVQDVPPERLLQRFPSTFRSVDDPMAKAEDRFDNLAQYDLVIAFDPDWTQLSQEQVDLLESWVSTHRGGLILVGGSAYTFELARAPNQEKLKKILYLYPVDLDDSRVSGERSTERPWRLHFPGANSETEFLKLDEDSKEALAGWEEFFTGGQKAEGPEVAVRHGFFSYYPVKGVKANATVIGTFSDPLSRVGDGKQEQPFLVSMLYGNGRVVWLGSGEMWRLRQYRETFYERFWTKLARYAGSGSLTQQNAHGVLVMATKFSANSLIRLQAQMFGMDMSPLARTEKPEAKIKPPANVQMQTGVRMQPKAGQGTDWKGWFEGQFKVTAPGAYQIDLPVPGTADVLSRKFTVKESNPELDNTAPDFERMRQLASDAGDVFSRVKDDARERIKAELERTNRIQAPAQNVPENELKLYLDLKAAEVIPDCMITNIKTQRSRGAVKDLWDLGPSADAAWIVLQWAGGVLGVLAAALIIRILWRWSRSRSARAAVFSLIVVGLGLIATFGSLIALYQWWPGEGQALPVSFVLLGIVTLLSIEWLTRKLLRLA
jgi:hypothetical protein